MKFRSARIITICLLLLSSGCQTVSFYHQAIVGQTRLIWQRESVEELLAGSEIDLTLRNRLELAREVIEYAQSKGIDAGNVFSSYVETGQPFIVWNVFAAPVLSLELKASCFPIAGCVTYRGYFKRDAAIAYASELRDEGFETYVAGVAAYSTLGWFDDPLLDTFLFRPEELTAALIFHELAHLIVYIKDDTRFNESAATTVERYLLRGWLESKGEAGRFQAYLDARRRRDAVIGLIGEARAKLNDVYESDLPDSAKLQKKAEIISALRSGYHSESAAWSTGNEFESWMEAPINNAKLETVADYNEWVPVMMKRLEVIGLSDFMDELQTYADMEQGERTVLLESGGLGSETTAR